MEGGEVDPEATLPPLQRRAADPRLERLVEDISGVQDYVERLRIDVAAARQRQDEMQKSIDINNEMTADTKRLVVGMSETVGHMNDLLASFRVLKTVAVWLSSIIAAAGATWAAWRQIKG